MATARLTFGAVLSTITATANTVTKAVSTVSDSVDMANQFVAKALADQQDSQKVHRKNYRATLLRDATEQEAVANRRIVEFCEDPVNKELWDQAKELFPDNFFDN